MTDLNEIFSKTAEQIKEPIKTDDLEYLLVLNGLTEPLKPIEISRRMKAQGFFNKIKQHNGSRARYWVTSVMTDTKIAHKIRFYKFLNEFLADKTEINAREINLAVKANGLDVALLQKHFYTSEGIERKWRGWLLIRSDGEKIYKNVDIIEN
jgi:hypothetical protein